MLAAQKRNAWILNCPCTIPEGTVSVAKLWRVKLEGGGGSVGELSLLSLRRQLLLGPFLYTVLFIGILASPWKQMCSSLFSLFLSVRPTCGR